MQVEPWVPAHVHQLPLQGIRQRQPPQRYLALEPCQTDARRSRGRLVAIRAAMSLVRLVVLLDCETRVGIETHHAYRVRDVPPLLRRQ